MKKYTKWILSLAIIVSFVQPVQAADLGHFYLDQGFIGHAVRLDADDGRVAVGWEDGALVKESELTIVSPSATEYLVQTTDPSAWQKKIWVEIKPEGKLGKYEEWRIEKYTSGTWVGLPTQMKGGYARAQTNPGENFRLVKGPKGLRKGNASWYRYKGCLCAASPDFPKGTKLLVKLASDPSKSVIVKVNDYGPDRRLFPTRAIDLDAVAFKKLAKLSAGLINVIVEPIEVPTSTKP